MNTYNIDKMYENYSSEIEKMQKCIDELQQENQKLKKQLEYLRSGEYYNQLRFENEMLQQVVDTNGVPSEVYDYIDCTHRNTELLEENQELKKQLEVGKEQYNDLVEEKEELQEQLSIKTLQLEEYKNQVDKGLYSTCLPYRTGYDKAVEEMENQQKEFISYLENEIYSIEPKGTGINYNCEYDSEEDYIKGMKEQSKLNTLKEILSKYQEIIGVSDEKEN